MSHTAFLRVVELCWDKNLHPVFKADLYYRLITLLRSAVFGLLVPII